MASSGTVGTPVVDFRFRPTRGESGREAVLIGGYVKVKSSAEIEAGDFTLRTIKSFNVTPYDTVLTPGGPSWVYGSVNQRGSILNSVTLRGIRGSTKVRGSSATAGGTWHYGTILKGTHQLSFIAVGA